MHWISTVQQTRRRNILQLQVLSRWHNSRFCFFPKNRHLRFNLSTWLPIYPVEWSGSMLIPGQVSTGELGLPPIDCKGKVSYPLLNISIDSWQSAPFQQHAEWLVINHVTRVVAIFMNERVASSSCVLKHDHNYHLWATIQLVFHKNRM